MSKDTPSNSEHVFLRSDSAGASGTLLMLAGAGGLVVAALGFTLALFGRPGLIALHAMSTLPAILSIGALTAGWTVLRTPRRVRVDRDGLTIESKSSARHRYWSEVGCASVGNAAMSHRRFLNITDPNGQSIVKLDESFDRFDEMVALISSHVEAKGDDTAARLLRKKARRQAILPFVFGLLMAVGCIFIAKTTRDEQRAARLLEEKGQPGQAEIVRRFVAPNGVTKRVEYKVVGVDGRPRTRNVEVEPAYWDSLEHAKSIDVIVVPGEPDVSRLESGEVTDKDFTKTPAGGYGRAALGGLLALFMLVASPFMWNGWDLSLDSKTRKWSVKRYGKHVA
jgi:hypothetical protein